LTVDNFRNLSRCDKIIGIGYKRDVFNDDAKIINEIKGVLIVKNHILKMFRKMFKIFLFCMIFVSKLTDCSIYIIYQKRSSCLQLICTHRIVHISRLYIFPIVERLFTSDCYIYYTQQTVRLCCARDSDTTLPCCRLWNILSRGKSKIYSRLVQNSSCEPKLSPLHRLNTARRRVNNKDTSTRLNPGLCPRAKAPRGPNLQSLRSRYFAYL